MGLHFNCPVAWAGFYTEKFKHTVHVWMLATFILTFLLANRAQAHRQELIESVFEVGVTNDEYQDIFYFDVGPNVQRIQIQFLRTSIFTSRKEGPVGVCEHTASSHFSGECVLWCATQHHGHRRAIPC